MTAQVTFSIPGYQEYPKWKYLGANGVLVHTVHEEQALGADYADAPRDELPSAPNTGKRGKRDDA